jgi:hypothetical protein
MCVGGAIRQYNTVPECEVRGKQNGKKMPGSVAGRERPSMYTFKDKEQGMIVLRVQSVHVRLLIDSKERASFPHGAQMWERYGGRKQCVSVVQTDTAKVTC